MANTDYDYISPGKTGAHLVTFESGLSSAQQLNLLQDISGSSVRSLSIMDESGMGQLGRDTPVLFDGLDVGYVPILNKNKNYAISDSRNFDGIIKPLSDTPDGIIAIEEETYIYAIEAPENNFYSDLPTHTWGLEAIGFPGSNYTGLGIKVAILDTGFDMNHPDFSGRSIIAKNFSSSSSTNDVNGHGTHCTGTAVGYGRTTSSGTFVRYGVANKAEIYIGKVLGDNGYGSAADAIDAIRWAVQQGCDIVSMSLGSAVKRGQPHSAAYEAVAAAALKAGTLVIAAAGNDSRRSQGVIRPVGSPANCPSIMAVGGVDSRLAMYDRSCGDVNGLPGSAIDIAAPGVNIFSSYSAPRLYARLTGTSMACPHVAGVAALLAEKYPSQRGQDLWNILVNTATPLTHPKTDVGSGLVRIP